MIPSSVRRGFCFPAGGLANVVLGPAMLGPAMLGPAMLGPAVAVVGLGLSLLPSSVVVGQGIFRSVQGIQAGRFIEAPEISSSSFAKPSEPCPRSVTATRWSALAI